MDRYSRDEYLSSFNRDVLDRLDRIVELMDVDDAFETKWSVIDLPAGQHPGEGWFPFAVTSPSPGVTFVWWRSK